MPTAELLTRTSRFSTTVVPHFMILGAAKCGTTSLHAWLDQHPQTHMSNPKEPKYFEMQYEKGSEHYLATCFEGWDGKKLLGESRHRNLILPWVPQRIKESNPNVKMIVLARNPIDRCLSHWWVRMRRYKDSLHFEDAVLADMERIASGRRQETAEEYARYQAAADPSTIYRTYVDTGYYAEQIERYRQYFPESQIRIFLFEDLQSRPKEVVRQVCEFVGLSTAPVDNIRCDRENPSKPMKPNRAFSFWLRQQLQRRSFPYGAIRNRPQIRPKFRAFLAEHFRPHNEAFAKMTSRDLSHWR